MTCRAIITGLILASAVAVTSADAQTSRSQQARICAQLEGDLARLQRAGNSRSSQNYKKYDAAIHKQISQIDSAEQRAKRDACYGSRGFLFRRSPKATCPALLKRIDKMKGNLAKLEKQRSRYTPPPSDTGAMRAQILRELGRTGCGDQYARFATPEPTRRRGLFGALFQPRSSNGVREYNELYDVPQIGTYRTVCVRSCDGYFFPVSFSTTESNFVRDEGVCQSSCQGASVELYVYKNPGEGPEDMVSLGGRPYQSLETAFLYQKEFVQGCSCQAPASQMAALTSSDQPKPLSTPALNLNRPLSQPVDTGPIVPLPMPKQAMIIDPDTRASERYGITFKPYRPPEVSTSKGVVNTADGRSIRIVGPKFFGAPE